MAEPSSKVEEVAGGVAAPGSSGAKGGDKQNAHTTAAVRREAGLKGKAGLYARGAVVTVSVWVPTEEIGLVIGDRGAGVVKLQAGRSVRVRIPKVDQSQPWAEVRVIGPPFGCWKTCDSIINLVEEIDDVVCSFRVWKERHHPLRSDSARRISAATGVRVFVPGKADPSDAVQLEGPIVAVVRAFYLFQAELYRMATEPARTVLKIPAAKVGLLIGTAGKTVKEIKSRTNATIDFHGHDAEAAARGAQAEAVMYGAKDSVALAKEIIERVVAGGMPRDVFTAVHNDLGVVLNVEGLLQATKRQGRGAGGKGSKGGSGGGGGRGGGGGGKTGKRRGGGNKKRGSKATGGSGSSAAGGGKTGQRHSGGKGRRGGGGGRGKGGRRA